MTFYVGDKTQVSLKFESGAYGTPSGNGIWPGMAQTVGIDENINLNPVRYIGGDSRNVSQFVKGPQDYTASLSLYPQDFRLLGFALGSIASAGSPSPYTHTLKEVNHDKCPFPSLQMEVAQKGCYPDASGLNFIRNLTGVVVNTLTITSAEGEIVTFDADLLAQDVEYSSGAVTAVTANTDRPFLWSDTIVSIPSGTAVANVTNATMTVNNNFRGPHYLNGSEVIAQPISQSRDYEVSLTLDGEQTKTKEYYDQYFIGGSSFNMQMRYVASAGSRDAVVTFSGCRITDMDVPTPNENVIPQTISIQPQSCSAVVADTIEVYGF